MRLGQIGLGLSKWRSGGSAPAPTYNPSTEMPGYYFSIDPSATSTLYTDTAGTVPVTAPGDLVACVRDPFTNAIVATQATSGNRPIYQVDGDGFHYLQLHDGTTNRWLATATLPFTTNSINRVLVVAAVEVTSTSSASADLLRLGTGFSNNFRFQFPGGSTTNIDVISNGGLNQTANITAAIGTPPDKIVCSFYTSIPSDLIRGRLDGVQNVERNGDQGTGFYGNLALGIGGRPDTGGGMRGRLYGLILAVSATTDFVDADVEPAEAYLDAKLNPSVPPVPAPIIQLGIINGTGDGGSSFATNFGGIVDYDEPVFMDRAKQARGWLRPNFSFTPTENKDSDGALASLPAGDTTQLFFFSSYLDDASGHIGTPDRSGRYRLTFTGSASVNLATAGSNVTMIDANTYEFDCGYVGNLWITFTPTAFPIKVSIVKTTDVAAHAGGQIFRQEFLDYLPASGGCYRFMDWMGTNSSPVATLADYPVESSQRWNRVPISALVNLCNTKGADPWICIPHQADDALVTNWAEYLRDNLNVARKIRVELSNEIWNTGTFTQGSYFKAQAEAVWLVADGYGGGGYWLEYAGKRFAQIMQIFNSVFVGQTDRLIGVIGGQAVNPTLSTKMLNAGTWEVKEPESYVAPYTLAEEYSIADYIGFSNGTTQGNEIKTAMDISQAAGVAKLKEIILLQTDISKTFLDGAANIAAPRGLRVTSYEYNNHFDLHAARNSNLYSGGLPIAGALDVFMEATYSQEMADALDDLRDYWKANNGSLKAFFVAVARGSRFGTWGASTHIGHNSPIWNDTLAWHTANPRWWAQ